MKNNNHKTHKTPPFERPLFIMIITFVGGLILHLENG